MSSSGRKQFACNLVRIYMFLIGGGEISELRLIFSRYGMDYYLTLLVIYECLFFKMFNLALMAMYSNNLHSAQDRRGLATPQGLVPL
jgi:hypothetical protein